MIKKLWVVLLVLLVCFSGCNIGAEFTEVGLDVDENVENLDPLFAKGTTEEMILINIGEGLVVETVEGDIVPGVATHWEVSDEGKTYTFTLRENSYWQKKSGEEKTKVTAPDFVFAFQRMFDPNFPSPHAVEFSAIQNSKEVLAGSTSTTNLGIQAEDDFTLVIQLEEADVNFLKNLATPPAFPCHEAYFQKTKGRYGFDLANTYGNGAYRLSRWESGDWFTLTENEYFYRKKDVLIETVHLFVGRDDPVGRYEDEITHILKAGYKTVEENEFLKKEQTTKAAFPKQTWVLGFKANHPIWGVPYFRQAMAYTEKREGTLPPAYQWTESLSLDGKAKASGYSLAKGEQLYEQGLFLLDIERVSGVVVYLPETGEHREVFLPMQKRWEKDLGLEFAFVFLSEEEIAERQISGDFDIMLIPLPLGEQSLEMLEMFTTGGALNIGYNNTLYDNLVEQARTEPSWEAREGKKRQAEQMLLSDGVVIPLYTEESYYIVGNLASEIEIFPYRQVIRFYLP